MWQVRYTYRRSIAHLREERRGLLKVDIALGLGNASAKLLALHALDKKVVANIVHLVAAKEVGPRGHETLERRVLVQEQRVAEDQDLDGRAQILGNLQGGRMHDG